jgi:hypothetical protein
MNIIKVVGKHALIVGASAAAATVALDLWKLSAHSSRKI